MSFSCSFLLTDNGKISKKRLTYPMISELSEYVKTPSQTYVNF